MPDAISPMVHSDAADDMPSLSSVPRLPSLSEQWSLADLRQHLGGVPLERIRLFPSPGTGTERDVLERQDDRLCELIDGVMVEKAMGAFESILAGILIYQLHRYLEQNPLGVVLAPDGMLRLGPGQVRMPDVSFVRWERFPGRRLPNEKIYPVAADLVVEILSPGNTADEMQRKLNDYLTAGTSLVWYVDPVTRSAIVHSASRATPAAEREQPTANVRRIASDGMLSGEDVLPGLEISLADLFERAERGAGSARGPA